jgi:hypothetical protein
VEERGDGVGGWARWLLLPILLPLTGAAAGPPVTADPLDVRPGAPVTIAGQLFGQCREQVVAFRPATTIPPRPVQVRVIWDGGRVLGLADLGPAADFSAVVTVPPDATPGRHTVTASCPRVPPPGTVNGSVVLTVLPPQETASPTPDPPRDPTADPTPGPTSGPTSGPTAVPQPNPAQRTDLVLTGLSTTAAVALLVFVIAGYRSRRAGSPAAGINAVPVPGVTRPARVQDLPGVAVSARVVARTEPRVRCTDVDRRPS